jgi:hypothetical protein
MDEAADANFYLQRFSNALGLTMVENILAFHSSQRYTLQKVALSEEENRDYR